MESKTPLWNTCTEGRASAQFSPWQEVLAALSLDTYKEGDADVSVETSWTLKQKAEVVLNRQVFSAATWLSKPTCCRLLPAVESWWVFGESGLSWPGRKGLLSESRGRAPGKAAFFLLSVLLSSQQVAPFSARPPITIPDGLLLRNTWLQKSGSSSET